MFGSRLNNILMKVNHLQEENVELHKDKVAARQTIDKHTAALEVLEAYIEIDNMMTYGLPESQPSRYSQSTFEMLKWYWKESKMRSEKISAEFCQQKHNVIISPFDISISHVGRTNGKLSFC